MTIASPTPATILVVDDLDTIRRMLTRMLTLAGHAVLEAADGAEALAMLRARPGGVDLVLTDVLMPRMNGTELARHVLQEFADTRIILMSAYLPEGTANVGSMGRTVPLMQKPIDWQELARTVGDVLAEDMPIVP
jgi:CheY-like chemotaxis protein